MTNPKPAYDRPAFFYGWSFLIPCACWLTAGYLSRHPTLASHTTVQGLLGLVGLAAPTAVAAWLFAQNPALWADLKPRLRWPRCNSQLLLALLLGPLTLIIAMLLSLLGGHSVAQFHISGQPSFSSALFSPWLLLALAPLLEELAWHSYGTDALLQRFSLLRTNLLFFIYWLLWHLPLATIRGYYQSNLVEEGWQYGVNFMVSMLCFVFIMNWLYLKSGRNLWIAVIFHLCANLGNEVFATHPDSKIIQSGLFLLVLTWLFRRDRQFFLGKPN